MNRCCRCTDRHYGATGINISNAYEPVQSPTQKSFQHQSLCSVRQNESRHQFHKSFLRTLSFTLRSPILLAIALISTHTLIHFKLYVYMRAPISVLHGFDTSWTRSNRQMKKRRGKKHISANQSDWDENEAANSVSRFTLNVPLNKCSNAKYIWQYTAIL